MTPVESVMLAVQSGVTAPLDVAPPLHGAMWTVVVPALLFVVAGAATFLLYHHFAGREHPQD